MLGPFWAWGGPPDLGRAGSAAAVPRTVAPDPEGPAGAAGLPRRCAGARVPGVTTGSETTERATYRTQVGSQEIVLPLVPLADDLTIALLICVDHGIGFSEQAGGELAEQLAPFGVDVVVSVATMGIPLAIEVTRALGLDDYVILHKTPKIHLGDALAEPVRSITTATPQRLLLDRARVGAVAGRRVAVVDDVISTGASTHGGARTHAPGGRRPGGHRVPCDRGVRVARRVGWRCGAGAGVGCDPDLPSALRRLTGRGVARVVTAPVRHRFTVEDWDRLVELGFFTSGDRMELLDGEIIDVAPMGDRHATCVRRLTSLLVHAAADLAVVNAACPVRLSRYSDPEPDFALLRPKDDWYASGRPTPADTLLMIEVSDSSRSVDRDLKLRLYAEAGIAEYWVIDLVDRIVDVHTEPSGGTYSSVVTHRSGGTLRPTLLPSVNLELDDFLG